MKILTYTASLVVNHTCSFFVFAALVARKSCHELHGHPRPGPAHRPAGGAGVGLLVRQGGLLCEHGEWIVAWVVWASGDVLCATFWG